MLRKILLALVAVIAIFAVIAAMQPDEFNVSRSTRIAAPPAAVFAQVNDHHKWQAWSPWQEMDPDVKQTFFGSKSGVGAAVTWAGNSEVGEGTSTIVDSQPNEFIKFQLDFAKPMKMTSFADFTFKPEGKETLVIWNMSGKKNFIAKAMGLIMNCEKMMGEQFDKGLGKLKSVVEKK